MEENTLAILDADESKDTRDANDDRMAYLQAVRAASLVPEKGTPPTSKMYNAIFQILRSGNTLESIMASYHLLKDLDKALNEAWSPFAVSLDVGSGDKEKAGKYSTILFDFSGFHQLIQSLTEVGDQTKSELSDVEILRTMSVFRYLVDVLVADFAARNSMFADTLNWNLVRESLLNKLLTSKQTNYKALAKDCVIILCQLHNACAMPDNRADIESYDEKLRENQNAAPELGLFNARRSTCVAMMRLLTAIMELDALKKKADSEGLTTRADRMRTPLLEMAVDELTYNRAYLSPFLQALDDVKWKLDIILQCFSKYISKPSVRTRKSTDPVDVTTLDGVLKSCFSSSTNAKSIVKKMGADLIQLLLSHAFHAQLTSSSQQQAHTHTGGGSLAEICNGIITAFSMLREVDPNMEILPFAKEALFTAATVLSTNARCIPGEDTSGE